MQTEFSAVFLSLVGALFYFILSYRFLLPYHRSLNNPLTDATKILLSISFIGFAIVLYNFYQNMINYCLKLLSDDPIFGLFIYLIILVLAFTASILVFNLSTVLTQIILKENEKAELAKNNFQVAGFHGIVFVFFTLLLSHPISQMVLTFVSEFISE
jgi:hypothetical protein